MCCKGILEPEKMPPAKRSAYYHGLRAHQQIISWKVLDDSDFELNVEDWGWMLTETDLMPIKTDMQVALKNLLKVVRCKCNSGTEFRPLCTMIHIEQHLESQFF